MATIAHAASASDRMLCIDAQTKRYRAGRDLVTERVTRLNDEVAATHKRLLPGIKKALAEAIAEKDALAALLDGNRDLFEKPTTITLHGVRVGVMKQKGKIEWESEEALLKAIRKQLPEQEETLIKTTHKPVRKALSNLPAATLRKLGCTVEEAGIAVYIKPTDGEVDKLVAALIGDGAVEGTEEE